MWGIIAELHTRFLHPVPLAMEVSAISGQDVNLPGWKVYQDEESQPASS